MGSPIFKDYLKNYCYILGMGAKLDQDTVLPGICTVNCVTRALYRLRKWKTIDDEVQADLPSFLECDRKDA